MKNYRFLMIGCAMAFCISALKAQSLAEAKRLVSEEQYPKAIVMLKQLCKADPSNSELSYNLGKAYFDDNIDDSATYFFEQTAKITPETPYTYLSAGRAALYKKDKIAAKDAFEKAISINKKDAVIIVEVGESSVNHDTSMISYVKELFAKNEKVCKKNARYYIVLGDISHMQGSGGDAVGQYEKAKEIDKKYPQTYMRIANVWQGARRYDLALQQLEEAEKIDPKFPPLLRELGEVKFLKGDFSSANEYYGKYLSLIGNNCEARIKKAKFLFLSKLYKEAADEINSILKECNSETVLYRLLAYSYYENKSYPEGLKAMDYFMSHEDASKFMYTDYSYYGRLQARNAKDSLAYLTLMKAYKMDSTDIMIWNELLMTSLNMKHYNDAIHWQFKRINALNGFNANEYQKVGQMYYGAGDYVQADSIFSMILQKTDTNNVSVIVWRARCYSSLDNVDKPKGLAKPYYQKVLVLGKKDMATNKKEVVEAYRYFGFYYYKTKKMKAALECFTTIRQIDPTFPGIDNIIAQIQDFLKKQAQAQKKKQQEDEEDAELDYLK